VDILPYIDEQATYDGWDRTKVYDEDSTAQTRINAGGATNFTLCNDIGVLRCPDDDTIETNLGNLSYVVNGGFSRLWAGPNFGYFFNPTTGAVDTSNGMGWGSDAAKATGVFSLGTYRGGTAWDFTTTPNSMVDGSSTTVAITENLRSGSSAGIDTRLTGGTATVGRANWASPHPNYVMFFGSDFVCQAAGCPELNWDVATQTEGQGWTLANSKLNNQFINEGTNLPIEGLSPFPSSYHSGGVNVGFCDGAVRFIRDGIDGGVWSRLLTPRGSRLGQWRQAPVSTSDVE
jgi:prepilin-type processing-associated H-X9-DG protein